MPIFTKPHLQQKRMHWNTDIKITTEIQLWSLLVCCYRTNMLCIGIEYWQRFGARGIKKKIKLTIFFRCSVCVQRAWLESSWFEEQVLWNVCHSFPFIFWNYFAGMMKLIGSFSFGKCFKTIFWSCAWYLVVCWRSLHCILA